MESHVGMGFEMRWVDDEEEEGGEDKTSSELICEEVYEEGVNDDDVIEEEYLVGEEIIPTNEINAISNSLDQSAAENLIYMAHDGNQMAMSDLIEEQVEQADNVDYNDQEYFECQVTEEVITDDWVQRQGEERVEIIIDSIGSNRLSESQNEADMDVSLLTDQDEYTASRPYPCDFCSRRFRKKANLMNHMVAHQNDRPHGCNLCGARYIKKVDLLNHLKIHAYAPEHEDIEFQDDLHLSVQRKDRRSYSSRTLKPKIKTERDNFDDHMIQEDVKLMYNTSKQPKQENYSIAPKPDRFSITDPRKPFVCQTCGLSFTREKALVSHSKNHAYDTPLECDQCGEMFWDIDRLREHEFRHQQVIKQEQQQFLDEEQEENSEDEDTNEVEDNIPYDEDNYPNMSKNTYGDFYCDICGLGFHRQILLKRHKEQHLDKTETNNRVKMKCDFCFKTFSRPLNLLAHLEMHARTRGLKCALCGLTFASEVTIKEHLISNHEFEMSSTSCQICGKDCQTGRGLNRHSMEHKRSKSHACELCNKSFYNKGRLKRHMESHRNKTVTCDQCDQEFPDGRSLMNHRHSHASTSGKKFPCYDCGKVFGSRSSQQIHSRVHTGEKPYGCRFCWKAFADGGTLRKHERIHTGERPYVCAVCMRAFNQRVVLREHIRSHHSAPCPARSHLENPFLCSVCSTVFDDPKMLVQHLIEHSDEITQQQRPVQTGPRRYKRRRKLKPQELKRLKASQAKDGQEFDYSGNEEQNSQSDDMPHLKEAKTPTRVSQRESTSRFKSRRPKDFDYDFDPNYPEVSSPRKRTYSNQNQELEFDDGQSFEISNLLPTPVKEKITKAKAAASAQASRPKMIHTQKTRVAVEDGKRKTKTLITRTESVAVKSSPRSKGKTIPNASFLSERPQRATPSKYREFKEEHSPSKNEVIIDDNLDDPADMDEDLEIAKRNCDKFSMDIVNDLEAILRSPVRSKLSESSTTGPDLSEIPDLAKIKEDIRPKSVIESRRNYLVKKSVPQQKIIIVQGSESPEKESHLNLVEIMEDNPTPPVKEKGFKCMMCNLILTTKQELLDHGRRHF